MANIVVNELSKVYTSRGIRVDAIANVSFEVAEGEMLVLLGPSGCGKTTTLRALSGLEDPTSGTIAFGDRTVFDGQRRIAVPTHKRNIGLVFQSFALWPHLTARQNIEYPLKARGGMARSDRAAAVDEIAELVELDERLLGNRPGQLSGGQQQRVALARALVSKPSVLFFDEPLSSLDTRLREQLRLDLKALHSRIGITGVYVTHDLQEGLTLGDRIAVMYAGGIKQIADPVTVFEEPNSEEVAALIGYRRVARVQRGDGGWTANGIRVLGDIDRFDRGGDGVDLFVRTKDITLQPRGADRPLAPGAVRFDGWTVREFARVGGDADIIVGAGKDTLSLHIPFDPSFTLSRDDAVALDVPLERLRSFRAERDEAVPAVELASVDA